MTSRQTETRPGHRARRSALRSVTAVLTALAANTVGLATTADPALAYCRSGMTIWHNASTAKALGVNTTLPTVLRSGLAGGLSQWNRSGSVLRYNAPTYTSGWLIYAFRGQHGYSSLMGSSPGIALTFATGGTPAGRHTGGDLILSNRFTWVSASQDIPNGRADVQTVAVHEVGHFTGLAHPWPAHCPDGSAYTAAEQASVMTTITTGTRRALNSDDIADVTTIY